MSDFPHGATNLGKRPLNGGDAAKRPLRARRDRGSIRPNECFAPLPWSRDHGAVIKREDIVTAEYAKFGESMKL